MHDKKSPLATVSGDFCSRKTTVLMKLKWHIKKYSSRQKRGVDFRSSWALSWGRPMSRFTRVARSRVSSVTLIPKESPSLHSNQQLLLVCIFWHVTFNL